MKGKIAITLGNFGQSYDKAIGRMAELGFETHWIPEMFDTNDTDLIVKLLKGYDAVAAGGELWNKAAIDQVRDTVRIIARHGVGYDKVDLEAATRAGIAVTNTPGATSEAVAEQALSLMLAVSRQIVRYDRNVRQCNWNKNMTNSLFNKTVGLVGFGAIAKQLAKLLKPFNGGIVAFDTVKNEQAAGELGVRYVEMDELLSVSDIVSLHVPLTEKTMGMVDVAFLSKMKPSAILVNTCRGKVVKEKALVEALQKGVIAGAGLDVYEAQPLPAESGLIGMENVVLTPHCSSYCSGAFDNMIDAAMLNISDIFSGKDPRNLLNPDFKNYRNIK